MRSLKVFFLGATIQVSLSCSKWNFEELPDSETPPGFLSHAPNSCCYHKHWGDEMYTFLKISEETFNFNCSSNCVYTNKGDSAHYCFKKGGHEPPTCSDNPVFDCEIRHNSSISSLNYNLNYILEVNYKMASNLSECKQNDQCEWPCYCDKKLEKCICSGVLADNNTNELHSQFMQLSLMMTDNEQAALRNTTPCSPLKENCHKCFGAFTQSLAQCGFYANYDACKETVNLANTTCRSCFCEFQRKCDPTTKCSEDKLEKVPIHKCNRECKTPSLKCVIDLTIERLYSDEEKRMVDGRNRTVLAYNGQIPGPSIAICEGDELVVNFENKLSPNTSNPEDTTTLHFHGIRQEYKPWADGVPYVSQCPSHKFFTYGFNATKEDGAPAGTYWYHSHVGAQRTNGAYGALIIKPNMRDADSLVIDDANNTIILQEWYHNSTSYTVASLLINGKGRIGEKISKPQTKEQELNYLKGKGATYDFEPNPSHNTFKTNYSVFEIKDPGKGYLFRIIGAISQNFPLHLSIEDHSFTAIAADSKAIQPVENLTDLWIAGGERFDIVVQTKTNYKQNTDPYKIRVFGYSCPNSKTGKFCTIAWLKYPTQTVNKAFVTKSTCNGFELSFPRRTINPVPNDFEQWEKRLQFPKWHETDITGNIYIADLRAIVQKPSIHILNESLIYTDYVEFENLTMKKIKMQYTNIPMVRQDPEDETAQCGITVSFTTDQNINETMSKDYLITTVETKTGPGCTAGAYCECEHVLKVPYSPSYWTEFVLINNNKKDVPAHPIHQHGGWYWVLGMAQFNHDINATFIREQDEKCDAFKQSKNMSRCLHRNYNLPPAKDTIQVPPQGYVIYRTGLDNEGTWLMHCHINYHVLSGMAMVLQIGGVPMQFKDVSQDWCRGPFNETCQVQPKSEGLSSIHWYLGMQPVDLCIKPGTYVTFNVEPEKKHNVNLLSTLAEFDNCTIRNPDSMTHFEWPAPEDEDTDEIFYFACGMDDGGHCWSGMKAKITVNKYCP